MLSQIGQKLFVSGHSITKSLFNIVIPLSALTYLNSQKQRMATTADFERINAKAEKAEKILADLQSQIEIIKKAAVKSAGLNEENQLIEENEELRKEIESAKRALFLAEVANGVRQVALPTKAAICVVSSPKTATSTSIHTAKIDIPEPLQQEVCQSENKTQQNDPKPNGLEKKSKQKDAKAVAAENKNIKKETNEKNKEDKNTGSSNSKKKTAASGDNENSDANVDVSRLDLRIGKIVSVEKHPDADSLYVEKVDVGEGHLRTVVSGLVKHVPINAMKDRIAVFMCNLKPASMRKVLSEGMIMCASGSEKTEILVPPTDSVIGDRVTCDEYPGTPDPQLNPKKKIWETLKPDMKTNADRVATYKGAPLSIKGKGLIVAPTLANAQIS